MALHLARRVFFRSSPVSCNIEAWEPLVSQGLPSPAVCYQDTLERCPESALSLSAFTPSPFARSDSESAMGWCTLTFQTSPITGAACKKWKPTKDSAFSTRLHIHALPCSAFGTRLHFHALPCLPRMLSPIIRQEPPSSGKSPHPLVLLALAQV